ncbi:hypothetical protein CLV35_0564 [Motilibacter peucedani]|uniref:Flagellar protein FlaG n=1 Tax=Motilibacter peucedani TaxID=598650 RepID=A0A420XTI2_9ACTN|nr:hypothetical protein [Motilibacter peucedani]RKS80143.1 hypothetical protein CLV35_0564 [Motilibacter peucedani]
MVEPVDPVARSSGAYAGGWPRQPQSPPPPPPQSAPPGAAAPAPHGSREEPSPELAPASQLDVQVVRRDSRAGEMGINVVRVLNPRTGEPIYQSPPEGVLVMLESALWRLRKKDSDG